MKLNCSKRNLPTLLLVSALLLFGPAAGASPASVQAEAQQASLRPRAVPMLLHLTEGRILRVRACQVDGDWDIQRHKDWTRLPSGLVDRAVVEADLLKQAKELDRKSSKRQPATRAAYAEWLASEGLTIEALVELDLLLKQDPELRAARDVIERQDFPFALPELSSKSSSGEVHDLASAAIKYGPAGREAAAQRLAQLEPSESMQAALLQNLVSPSASRRSFAALALRRAVKGKHVQPLMQRAVLDPSDEVRMSASLALAAVGDPQLVGPVLRALDSKSSQVRLNAGAALGHMGYPSAVAPLLARLNSLQSAADGRKPHSYFSTGSQQAYVQDFDVEVAAGSAIADPIVNVLSQAVVLDVAVLSTSERPILQERASIRRALSKLTGASPGNSTKQWMQWWDENRVNYQADKKPIPTHTTSRAL